MKRLLVVSAALLVAGYSRPGLADQYDTCMAACNSEYTACLEQANELVNEIEIQERRAACEAPFANCTSSCTEPDQTGTPANPPAEGEGNPEQ